MTTTFNERSVTCPTCHGERTVTVKLRPRNPWASVWDDGPYEDRTCETCAGLGWTDPPEETE